ncbi:MAG: exodeoxyribonuclease VII small subunit [Christensenellaceae bacterium]|nr:exodeoxyribonuclease VII small subunit [Christensenellaceae bacterium]
MAKKKNSFESSLNELENIVLKMENESTSIDEMLTNYEKASEIIKKLEYELNEKKQKFFIINEKLEMIEGEI